MTPPSTIRNRNTMTCRHAKQTLIQALFGCGLIVLLSGCSLVPTAGPVDTAGALVKGSIHGGQQPVANSTVMLFATTSNGYDGTPNLLATTSSDADGNWSINTPYTCPAGQQAYVVAMGGNPGLSGTVNNSAIFLVAALGSCTTIGASTHVNINEVTTVAAAYALSGFLPQGGSGLVAGGITTGVTTSPTNTQGLRDAFANANNIVDFSAGVAYTVPASTTDGTAPQATMNSLADILQDCVNSSGPSSAACVSLFATATPPVGAGVSAPVNIFQAAINVARYPGNNVNALYVLASPVAAFMPVLASVPNDWTVAVTYTGGQLATAQGLTIDETDNVWISGSTYAALAELSPQGAALSPVTGTTTQAGWMPSVVTASHNIRNLAFDTSGKLWLPDSVSSQVYTYVPGGTPTTPLAGTLTAIPYISANANLGAAYDIGIDGSGNVWLGSYKKNACGSAVGALCAFVELEKSGSTYTVNSTFNSNTYTLTNSAKTMAVDANPSSPGYGSVWIAPNNASNVQIFQSPYTSQPLNITLSATTSNPQGMAIDGSGNAWLVGFTGGKLFQVSPTGTVLNTVTNTTEFQGANFISIDGNGNLFVPNFTTSTVAVYSPGFDNGAGVFLSPNTGLNPRATLNVATSKYTGGVLSSAVETGIDRSGALWVLNQGTGSVVQILGVAAPTRPVLASGQYGVKP